MFFPHQVQVEAWGEIRVSFSGSSSKVVAGDWLSKVLVKHSTDIWLVLFIRLTLFADVWRLALLPERTLVFPLSFRS
jgi:hypothetical protein